MITSIYQKVIEGRRKSINLKYNIKIYKDKVEYSWMDKKRSKHVEKYEKNVNEYKILRDAIVSAKGEDNSSAVFVVLLLLSVWELFYVRWIVFFSSLVVFYYILGLFIQPYVNASLCYKLDEKRKNDYQTIKSIFKIIKNNDKIWIVTSECAMRRRTNGGAGISVTRFDANISNEIPFGLHSNITTICINWWNGKMYFLPDKLLVIIGDCVESIDYKILSFEISSTRFVETEDVQMDSTIIEQTWLNVNNDGSPDRRFSYNRKVPVCKYAEVRIKAEPSLDLKIHCSNLDTVKELINQTCDIFPITNVDKVSYF